MLDKAISLAVERHAGQTDKGGAPYVLHLLRVMLKMGSEAEQCAAVLHDILEDTSCTVEELVRAGFANNVVEAVQCLTKRKEEAYPDYLNRVRANSMARAVKLADLEDNMNLERLPCISQADLDRQRKYGEAKRHLQTEPTVEDAGAECRLDADGEQRDAAAGEPDWQLARVRRFCAGRTEWKLFAGLMEQELEGACRRLSPLALVNVRVKDASSYAEKIVRKQEKFLDPEYEFTDLCGARIIAHTSGDVARLCRWVETHFEIDRTNSQNTAERLNPDAFGYLSMHYVVSFRECLPSGLPCPAEMRGRKAELQVRTLLQHAWADIMHDRFYKNRHEMPSELRRECSRIAAVLENTDADIVELIGKLDDYHEHYAVGMPARKLEKALESQQLLYRLETDAGRRSKIGTHIAELLNAGGRYEEAMAFCRATADRSASMTFQYARAGAALALLREDASMLADCADRMQRLINGFVDENPDPSLYPEEWVRCSQYMDLLGRIRDSQGMLEDARRHARDAFSLQPDDPYLLAECLMYESAAGRSSTLLRPQLEAAAVCCRRHVQAGIELPRAHFTLARFHACLGDAEQSVIEFCKGVDWMRLHPERLSAVQLARESRFFTEMDSERLGLIRQAAEVIGSRLRNREIGDGIPPGRNEVYRHAAVIGNAEEVEAFSRHKQGAMFLESVRAFAEVDFPRARLDAALLSSESVVAIVLGNPVEKRQEIALCLAAGATVVLPVESAFVTPESTLGSVPMAGHPGLAVVPYDADVLVAVVRPDDGCLSDPERERLGRAIHEQYLLDNPAPSSACRAWENIDETLRRSNILQAIGIRTILAEVGIDICQTEQAAEPVPLPMQPAVLERLAALEHARFVAERTTDGWTYANLKDVAGKRSPALLPWSSLTERYRQMDRDEVSKWPQLLALVGYRMVWRRIEDESGRLGSRA